MRNAQREAEGELLDAMFDWFRAVDQRRKAARVAYESRKALDAAYAHMFKIKERGNGHVKRKGNGDEARLPL